MRRLFVGLAIVAVAVLTSSPVQADDAEIAKTVVKNLRFQQQAGNLQGFDIKLKVRDGNVYLAGRLSSPAQRTLVLESARRVPGVKTVFNGLTVPTQPSAMTPSGQRAAPSSASVGTGSARPSSPATRIKRALRQPRSILAAMRRTIKEQAESTTKPLVQPAAEPAVKSPAEAQFKKPEIPAVATSTAPASSEPARKWTPREAAALTTPALPPAATPATPASAATPTPPAAAAPAAKAPAPKAVPASIPAAVSASAPAAAPASAAAQSAKQPARASRAVSQTPVPFAPARSVRRAAMAVPAAMVAMAPAPAGAPIPAYVPGTGGGIAPARYDHPRMPGYAWPGYASYPNYAALTYPKQYSPTAWPYIGPFYPYPQVPLGWRKVVLEWDDGWWMLDFKSK